jgi:hypothetical protein
MDGRPARRAWAGERRRGFLVAVVALGVIVVGAWIVGSIRTPGPQLAVAPSGSASPPGATPAPTRRPVVTSPQTPPTSREIDLFGMQLQLTIPGGTYSDSRNQATIVSPSMRVLIERWAAGSSHTIARGITGSVSGSTLDAVADAVEPLLQSEGAVYVRRAKTIDYHDAVEWVASRPVPTDGPFVVTVVIDDSKVYLVEAFATEPGLEGITLARFVSLQTSMNFLTSSDITALGGRVSLRLPGVLHVATSTTRLLDLDGEFGLFGFGKPFSIQRVALGSRATIVLPGQDGVEAVVEGRSLGEIVASLERTSGGALRKGIRATMTVDGHAGSSWNVLVDTPFSEYFGPLHVRIGVVVVGRNAYVIIGDDDDLIESIRFLR